MTRWRRARVVRVHHFGAAWRTGLQIRVADPFLNGVPPHPPLESPRTPTYRVLIVDDNPSIHEDFRKILTPNRSSRKELAALGRDLLGEPEVAEPDDQPTFEVETAFQGEAAVALVERAKARGAPFALAFVDVSMPPGIDGIETIARMWEFDPHVQVVVCSAYSQHSFTDMVRRLGRSDGLLVLRKPFESIEVLQAAHALTQKWTVSNQLRARLQNLEEAVAHRTAELEVAITELRDEVEHRKRLEAEALHTATHDALTGIPNRHLLRSSLGRAVQRAKRSGANIGVLLLDLDHFKEVNDTYGHAAGDELLEAVAGRLQRSVRECDVVARMGGDEFVVLLEDLREPEEASLVASRILATCHHPFHVAGEQVHTPPSIGIAIYPHDGSDPETLLKAADVAMYEAKGAGRGSYRYYTEGMLASSEERLRIREELNEALSSGEFRLAYQPLVDSSSGAVCAFEALLRWQHPRRGMVAPLKFIPVAEKSGLIVQIGAWMLREACAQLAEWRARGHRDLRMAVNVSAREVQAPGFSTLVTETLQEFQLPPDRLELELTESVATIDAESSARVLRHLTTLGVRLAIDDFGSGYSSLMRLKQMPISVLKIDRDFVRDISSSPSDAAIVRAVVEMAHSMGLTVVAEGVETHEQLALLRAMPPASLTASSCDLIQGYLMSKPLDARGAADLLEALSRDRLALTGS